MTEKFNKPPEPVPLGIDLRPGDDFRRVPEVHAPPDALLSAINDPLQSRKNRIPPPPLPEGAASQVPGDGEIEKHIQTTIVIAKEPGILKTRELRNLEKLEQAEKRKEMLLHYGAEMMATTPLYETLMRAGGSDDNQISQFQASLGYTKLAADAKILFNDADARAAWKMNETEAGAWKSWLVIKKRYDAIYKTLDALPSRDILKALDRPEQFSPVDIIALQ